MRRLNKIAYMYLDDRDGGAVAHGHAILNVALLFICEERLQMFAICTGRNDSFFATRACPEGSVCGGFEWRKHHLATRH
jgi:hypothetical protein